MAQLNLIPTPVLKNGLGNEARHNYFIYTIVAAAQSLASFERPKRRREKGQGRGYMIIHCRNNYKYSLAQSRYLMSE